MAIETIRNVGYRFRRDCANSSGRREIGCWKGSHAVWELISDLLRTVLGHQAAVVKQSEFANELHSRVAGAIRRWS